MGTRVRGGDYEKDGIGGAGGNEAKKEAKPVKSKEQRCRGGMDLARLQNFFQM